MATKKSTAKDTPNKLAAALDGWDDAEELEDEEETVGFESNRIEGHQIVDVKITMAKLIKAPKKKLQYIEIDFMAQDGKEHREQFMIKGSDGNPFYVYKKKKRPHFGVSKIKSLINVLGLYSDEKNKMKALFSNTDEAEVEFEEYGKDVKQDYVVFPDLIGKKVQLAIKSKKENSRTEFSSDDAYLVACQKGIKAFAKANPKKKFAAKAAKQSDEYCEVYRYFTNTEVAHFATTDGLLQAEMADGEGVLMAKFLSLHTIGDVYDGRTLIVEDLSEGEREELNIDEYGKQIVDDEDESYEEEPEEEEAEEEEEDEWGEED